jgi:hypothetical protein
MPKMLLPMFLFGSLSTPLFDLNEARSDSFRTTFCALRPLRQRVNQIYLSSAEDAFDPPGWIGDFVAISCKTLSVPGLLCSHHRRESPGQDRSFDERCQMMGGAFIASKMVMR